MKTKFKTKEKIQFTTKNSTSIFNEVIKVKFKSFTVNDDTISIYGFWYFTEGDVNKKIDKLSIKISLIYFKQKEISLGEINVIDIRRYIDKRLEQIFPDIIDQDTSNTSKPNSNLKGSDLELIEEEPNAVDSYEVEPEEEL